MAVQLKIPKPLMNEEKDLKKEITDITSISNNLNAPKHGTVIPNRVFVGGISTTTTEQELTNLFAKYGNVIATKIISDRAGVSKGYGFVTFETEEEARKSQNDLAAIRAQLEPDTSKADNIVLGTRKLNIAPAIKKQGFVRGNYECAATTPLQAQSQVFRHNGYTYTYQNGMAFFPQPPQPLPQHSHIEPAAVFQQGGAFNAVPSASPGPTYSYSYNPQGQFYYQTLPPFHYQMPYEAGYDGQMVFGDGNVMLSPFYIANPPQPTQEITYFQAAPPILGHETPYTQVFYPSPRGYDTPILYTPEHKCGMENGMASHNGAEVVIQEDVSRSNTSSAVSISVVDRSREPTPVVSLLKIQESQQPQHWTPNHFYDQGGNYSEKELDVNAVAFKSNYIRRGTRYLRQGSRQSNVRVYQKPREVFEEGLKDSPAVSTVQKLPPHDQHQAGTQLLSGDNELTSKENQDQEVSQASLQDVTQEQQEPLQDQTKVPYNSEQQAPPRDQRQSLYCSQQQIASKEPQRQMPPQQQMSPRIHYTPFRVRQPRWYQREQQTPSRDQQQRFVADSRRTPFAPSHPPSPFTYYPRHALPHPSNHNSYYPPPHRPPTARSRSFHQKPKHNGSVRGRGKWMHKGEETGNQLTPPDTPRIESTKGSSASSSNKTTTDVVQSMKTLTI